VVGPVGRIEDGKVGRTTPVPERLAEWFAGRLRAALAEHGASNIKRLTVGIEEMPGQAGWYTAE